MPKQKRRFEVEIEAKLTVLAFDEARSQEGRAALAAGRQVGANVEGTGAVWTYVTTPQPVSES